MKTLCIVKNNVVTKNAESDFEVAKFPGPLFLLIMVIKTPPFICIVLSSMLFLCSCDKPKLLMAEKDHVESEIKRLLDEAKTLDGKFFSLGIDAATASMKFEMQNRDLARRNTLLEQELTTLSKKCTEGEEMIKSLLPRLESYKAKLAR